MSLDFLTANDRPGEYPDSYYAASTDLSAASPPLEGDVSADVCIVGGGYTGLSAALHCAELGLRVVLLEANRVGWGASGRNGGQLGAGQRVEQPDLEKLVGVDHARRLWGLARESVGLVKSLIGKHAIDCDLKAGVLHADHKSRYTHESRAFVEHMENDYDYHAARFVDRDELCAMIGSTVYHSGVLDTEAAHLHPLRLAVGLAKAARGAGAILHEDSRVTALSKGTRVRLDTAKGSVTADHVLIACNGYLGDLEPKVAARVMPINNYVIATEPLCENLARELIRDDVAVADSKFVVNYWRLSSDRRLLFGGRESYRYRFPDNIKSFVRKPMLYIYPKLCDVKIDYGWGGTLAVTMNRLPHFERLSPNILSTSGYSGHGVGMATLAGKLAAEAISGQADRFDTFAAIPSPSFPGGPSLRSPLLILGMLYYSLRDRF